MSFGGLLGIGNKLFAVRLQAPKQDADSSCFILDATNNTLEKAHGFDKDHWPDVADRTRQTAVHKHYNTPTYWG